MPSLEGIALDEVSLHRLVVVLEHMVTIYSFPALTQVQQLETLINPRGLAALTTAATVSLLALPGLQEGDHMQFGFLAWPTGPCWAP